MIGAISSRDNEAFMEVYPKTNKECVYKFFEKYLPEHEGALLVLDNHKAHKGRPLRELC